MPKDLVLSRSFMKRLVRRLYNAGISIFPKYTLYFDQSSSFLGLHAGIEGSSMPMKNAIIKDRIETEAGGYGSDGQTTLGVNNKSVLFTKIGADTTPGIKQSIVAKNMYMNSNSDAESLQSTVSIPAFIQELDYSFSSDWATDELTPPDSINWAIDLKVTSTSRDTSNDAKNWLKDRWSWASNEQFQYASETSLNPYLKSNQVPYGQYFSSYVIDRWCSDLKNVNVGELGLRFIGSTLKLSGSSAGFVNHDLLKIDFNRYEQHGYYSNVYATQIEPYVNHGCEIVYMQGPVKWLAPVLAQRSGKIKSTRVDGPLLNSQSYEKGCNVFNFNQTTNDIVVSSTQDDYKTKTAVVISKGGAPGRLEFFIERSLMQVIESNLTCHLPETFSSEHIPYFCAPGRWARKNSYFTQSYPHQTIPMCLGPVMFPSCQEPDSEWLWYVSQDETSQFWLNKQKLGYASRSIAVTKLDFAPLQMEAVGDFVYMITGNCIYRWSISTSNLAEWQTKEDIPDLMISAVAIDRYTEKVWIGHKSGVFQFDNGSVSHLPLDSWPSDSKSVGLQGLSASNGFISWSSAEYFEYQLEYGQTKPMFACWYDSSSHRGKAFSYFDLFPAWFDSQNDVPSNVIGSFIGRVSVRSNGDLIVTHHLPLRYDAASYTRLGMSVFEIDATLEPTLRMTTDTWTHSNLAMNAKGHRLWLLPLKVVKDVKVLGGHVRLQSVLDDDASMQNYATLCYEEPRFNDIIDITLDDGKSWIHQNPFNQESYDPNYDFMPNSYSSTGIMFDRVNYPWSRMSACDAMATVTSRDNIIYAQCSMSVIELKGTFAVLFCGQQILGQGGMPMSWNGLTWEAPKAGKKLYFKKADSSPQLVDTATSVTFDMNKTYSHRSSYGFVCMPSTSDSAKISIYLGDYVTKTETINITSNQTSLSCRQIDGFYGIDISRTETLRCVINGTDLTHVDSNPASSEFAVSKGGYLLLSLDHVGSTATVSYNFIAQR
jgi:hypothetical protein